MNIQYYVFHHGCAGLKKTCLKAQIYICHSHMLNPAALVIWLAMLLTQLAGIQIDARFKYQLEMLVSI